MAVLVYKKGQMQKVKPGSLQNMLNAGWYLDEACTDNGQKKPPAEPATEPEKVTTSAEIEVEPKRRGRRPNKD